MNCYSLDHRAGIATSYGCTTHRPVKRRGHSKRKQRAATVAIVQTETLVTSRNPEQHRGDQVVNKNLRRVLDELRFSETGLSAPCHNVQSQLVSFLSIPHVALGIEDSFWNQRVWKKESHLPVASEWSCLLCFRTVPTIVILVIPHRT